MSNDPHNLFQVDHDQSKNKDVFLQSYQMASAAEELIKTAHDLVGPRGRGIYATDETPNLIEQLLGGGHEAGGGEEHKVKRNQWRKAAYSCLENEYISGVILYSDTLFDNPDLVSTLTSKEIIPGIRANGELVVLPKSPSEFHVEGLDNLIPTLQAARKAGARFSKWRVQIACTQRDLPTDLSLDLQAKTLASFAVTSQQAGLVPIVEPDVEFSADADLARSVEVHQNAIRRIFTACLDCGVLLEGTLIKPSFPQPGLKHPDRDKVTPEDIALATASVISNAVPIAVPGVVFLSGGLPPKVATSYLAALNALVNEAPNSSPFSRLPPLSFSFGRALQGDAMQQWVKGDEDGMRASFAKMSKACSAATKGEMII